MMPCKLVLAPALILTALLCSCTKTNTSSEIQHGTVLLRDGTRLSGNVTTTSPTAITLIGEDNLPHAIAMRDVKSISYDEAPLASSPLAGSPVGSTPVAPPVVAENFHQDHYHPPVDAIRSKTYTLAAGTSIPVRSEETIDSQIAATGQTYAAEVTHDVLDRDGAVVIPRGSNAQIVIRSSARGGRIRGASDLVLDLDSVAIGGQQYELNTSNYVTKGRDGVGKNRRTAFFTGGGAAIGAIIGAIAGGGKGAAIGAAAGAGAGAGSEILTKGGAIRVPAESVLTFRLDAALRVVAAN